MSEIWENLWVQEHSACLVRSLLHWTGRTLLDGPEDSRLAQRLFEAPFVLVSHGTEADPILNYGNRRALELWELGWDELRQMPSRLTAEAPNRAERARLLEAVTRNGYIDDYSGVRISRSGRRFQIARATVWNLVDKQGIRCGQAALFSQWSML